MLARIIPLQEDPTFFVDQSSDTRLFELRFYKMGNMLLNVEGRDLAGECYRDIGLLCVLLVWALHGVNTDSGHRHQVSPRPARAQHTPPEAE